MSPTKQTGIALLTLFGVAATGFTVTGYAASQIPVEQKIIGEVTQWSRSSCNNMWNDTVCTTPDQTWKSYAEFEDGTVLDVSHALNQNFDRVVSEAFRLQKENGETKPVLFEATYTQSALDIILPIPLKGKVNAHYASAMHLVK